MPSLINQKCKPCSNNTPKLTINEIERQILSIDEWKLNESKEMIFKKLKFKNFKKALFQ